MKKILFITLFLFAVSVTAQNRWEKIKSLKVAFLTEELNLTEKESQKFWPVYNDFEEKMNKIRYKEIKSIRKEIREGLDTMSNEEAVAINKRFQNAENEMQRLRNELVFKLSKIISPKKMIKLKLAEEDFKKKMLEEFKKRKKEKS